jgi:hypothetical protein
VRNRNSQLRRCKRTAKRGIRVADDDGHDRPALRQEPLDPLENGASLGRVRSGSHLEIVIRRGDSELAIEQFIEHEVIVLARVDGHHIERACQGPAQDTGLDDLRPRAIAQRKNRLGSCHAASSTRS